MIILAAGTTGTVIATVVAFLVIALLLVSLLLFVKQKLSPSGPVKILINGEREIEVASGGTLLSTLGIKKYFYHLHVEVVEHVYNVNAMF
jgi:Na+-transporting NADH:ubiquinone oxidoreductase subunit F